MFVAHHADRSRRVRLAFVALCLLPAVLLAGIGAWRHTPFHRESLRRTASSALGVDVSIGGVEHLRPGVVALERLALGNDARRPPLTLSNALLEISSREVRLRTAAAEITPEGATLLVRLARSWLFEPGRFGRDVVIEIAAATPVSPGVAAERAAPFTLRVECVAAAEARAIRLVAGPGDADWCLVQSFAPSAEAPARVEASGSWTRDLPVGLVAAGVDRPALAEIVGPSASFTGSFTASVSEIGRRVSVAGAVEGIDLAACTAGLPMVAQGTVRLDVEHATIDDGRIVEAAVRVSGRGGVIGRGTLDTIAAALGGRAIATSSLPAEAPLRYDSLRLRAVIDEQGIVLEVPEGGSAILAGGRGLIDLPAGPVPVTRLAWALSPEPASTVPATRQSAWLLSVMPLPRAATSPPPGSSQRR